MSEKQEQVVDTDAMSMDELRQLAEQEVQPGGDATELPRDDKGRFVAPKEDAPADEEPAVTVYRREIDLGDGSGKEVFEAASMEELLDKIVDAKRNATKKIREQQQKLREIDEAKQQASEDEEFVYSQELMAKPTEALKKMFKQMTGYDISEFKTMAERSKALEAAQAQQEDTRIQEEASAAFVKAHSEYVPNEANGKRLVKAINLLIGEAKSQGQPIDYADILEQAYKDLKESGLLQLQTEADASVREPAPAPVAAPRAAPAPTPSAPRQASSLTSRSRVITPPRNSEPSEEELYSMDLNKLRELADRQVR